MISFLLLMYFPFLPVNSIPMLLFAVVCLTDWPKVKDMFNEYRLVVLIILFTLILGILLSYKPQHSIKGVYDFLRGVVIFFPALYMVRKYPEKVKASLVWVCLFCSLLYLSYVIFAVLFVSSNFEEQRVFLSKCLDNVNTYGTSAALIALVSISVLLLLHRNTLERYTLFLTIVIGSGELLYSGSRGSVVSLFFGVIVLMLIRFRKHFVLILFGASASILSLFCAIYFNLSGNYLQVWARGEDVTTGRLKIYAATLNDLWQHALFFGFGPNTFKYLDYGQALNVRLPMPHSVYLECLFSLGIVGSLFMAVAIFVLVRKIVTTFSLSFYSS
ncbi:MAG: O-antigen ligase family protein, partial [Desulfobulbaceae bacterium]|nr:O-antigen ligase family protein [Desulfobulbaceae bacterium]